MPRSSSDTKKSLGGTPATDQSLTALQALWKAFTKSFRLSLLDIATYIFFIAPSLGMFPCPFIGVFSSYILCGDSIFLNEAMRKIFLLIFVIARTLQPLLLMINDKLLKKKIGAIVRDVSKDS